MKTTSYFGTDAVGATWARACVVDEAGVEHASHHVSVRVQPGRDHEAAMRLASELLSLRMATTRRAMVSGGAA